MAFVPFIAVRNFPRFRSDAPTINSHQCDVFPRRRLTRVTVHNTSAVRASANQAEEPMKLTYFDTRGGSEPIRLALIIGQVPFTDDRVSSEDWPSLKPEMPYGSLPLLTEDGVMGAQTMSILRYVGKRTGLYPDDAQRAFFVDEVIDTLLDLFRAIIKANTGVGPDSTDESKRQGVEDAVHRYWGGLDRRIEAVSQDGPFVLGSEVSIADLVVLNNALGFRTFLAKVVSTELFAQYPRMAMIVDAVLEIPEVVDWHEKYPVPPVPCS